jgi:glycosyltransferase involved in cell wall biosynthesis
VPAANVPPIYIFGWPSAVGGADTKLADLISLLGGFCQLTLVPNSAAQLAQKQWRHHCEARGARCCLLEDLPARLTGIGIAFCNGHFFTERIAHRAQERGLRIVWSGEMMWHHPGELEAIRAGVVEQVLYVSPLQRAALSAGHASLPWAMTGNYVDPDPFPFAPRHVSATEPFTIGRLSRPDPDKYPEDFPAFYEALDLSCRYRVMAWSEALAQKYRWHPFGPAWDLLPAGSESAAEFLASLDLFIYPLGHRLIESWGRVVVEAMLTGCLPLVPPGHHLEHLFAPGETGFVCGEFREYQNQARALRDDPAQRLRRALQARDHALATHCCAERHRRLWLDLFSA